MKVILHITSQGRWMAALETGRYEPESLATDGFIHCSSPGQIREVANIFYSGRAGLVLLAINPDQVDSEIRYEDCYDTGQSFPHIYGPLPTAAVIGMHHLHPGPDGQFADFGPWVS